MAVEDVSCNKFHYFLHYVVVLLSHCMFCAMFWHSDVTVDSLFVLVILSVYY